LSFFGVVLVTAAAAVAPYWQARKQGGKKKRTRSKLGWPVRGLSYVIDPSAVTGSLPVLCFFFTLH
jgi:hypothetical protein